MGFSRQYCRTSISRVSCTTETSTHSATRSMIKPEVKWRKRLTLKKILLEGACREKSYFTLSMFCQIHDAVEAAMAAGGEKSIAGSSSKSDLKRKGATAHNDHLIPVFLLLLFSCRLRGVFRLKCEEGERNVHDVGARGRGLHRLQRRGGGRGRKD